MSIKAEEVRRKVREGYGRIAKTRKSCCAAPTRCGSSAKQNKKMVQVIGYASEDLKALPEGANMGLSCGNPTTLASLKSGETILDLGSGGGLDVFIAGQNVGRSGHVIGVDMTAEMLSKARRNIEKFTKRTGLKNVEFRLGEIEHLPVADNSVDVIISNCVINLSPDKPQVWREMARVLKPDGRVAVSDLALIRPLPPKVLKMVEALMGCIAGAVLVKETERMARAAGLIDLVLKPKPGYVEAMDHWTTPLYVKIIKALPRGMRPADFITSLDVSARKPK
jgi:arsenite methyltransferase